LKKHWNKIEIRIDILNFSVLYFCECQQRTKAYLRDILLLCSALFHKNNTLVRANATRFDLTVLNHVLRYKTFLMVFHWFPNFHVVKLRNCYLSCNGTPSNQSIVFLGNGYRFRYSFICQGTSTRRQRRELFGLPVKLSPVTTNLTTQR